MANNYAPTVADVFGLLDEWRHLPAYGLETRVAPFFALFLREVLSARFGVDLHSVVIPEFPLRKGTLYGESSTQRPNQSFNVDYVAFSTDDQQAYLVELKTDIDSQRSAQDKYLCHAKRLNDGFTHFVSGILEICKATKSRQKYVHLLHHLSNIGLVSISGERIYDFKKLANGKFWIEALQSVKATARGKFKCIEVLFIQPRATKYSRDNKHKFVYIYFDEVADIVEQHGELGSIFANHLREWTCPAGSRDPRGPR